MTRDWVYVDELRDHVGSEVEVRGWVARKRSSGKIRFVVLRDGAGMLQCVAGASDVPGDVFEAMDRVPIESSVAIRGIVREEARAPGGHELGVTGFRVFHE